MARSRSPYDDPNPYHCSECGTGYPTSPLARSCEARCMDELDEPGGDAA